MPEFSVFGDDFDPSRFAAGSSPFAVQPGGYGKSFGGPAAPMPVEPTAAGPQAPTMVNGLRYIEPTLQAAQPGKFDTPYYAAYTNSGDLGAATYAAEGQKVRLVDPKTGAVLYEGVGPEGAKYATGIANALSQDKGRKASWSIELDRDGNFTQTGYDRKDPKHNLLGKIADFALPLAGALLVPGLGLGLAGALGAGVGAAGGSTLSSIAQGRSVGDTLLRAGISGLGAGVVGPAVGRAFTPAAGAASGSGGGAASGIGSSITAPGVNGAVDFGRNLIMNGAGHILGDAAGSVAPVIVTGASSALPSAIAGGALSSAASSVASGSNVPQAPSSPPQARQPQQPTDVDEVIVTASKQFGMKPETIAAVVGLPVATVTAVLTGGSSGGAAAGKTSLMDAIKGGPDDIGKWIVANPLQAAQLGLVTAGTLSALFGGNGGGSGSGGLSGGIAAAGTSASLDPIFRAKLPPSRFSVPRTQRDMSGTDWKRYGMGPQQRFFVDPPGMKRGGDFAVEGEGDGRSDRVPALLSDGEYVIDAETVALLGNGSNKAGARALDDFRVNIRKHKGKDLAAGKFTVKAKRPEAYVKGAR